MRRLNLPARRQVYETAAKKIKIIFQSHPVVLQYHLRRWG